MPIWNCFTIWCDLNDLNLTIVCLSRNIILHVYTCVKRKGNVPVFDCATLIAQFRNIFALKTKFKKQLLNKNYGSYIWQT